MEMYLTMAVIPPLVSLFCLFTSSVLSSQAQYYYSSPDEPSSFALALSARDNMTTQEHDLLLTLSALPTKDNKGWSAVGIGEVMANSLMFIIFADEARKRLAVTVRSAHGHSEPVITADLPEIRTIEAAPSDTGYHEAQIICYSCSRWASLDINSNSQPWIWASNYFQVFQNADSDHTLISHQLYGRFIVDMRSTVGSPNDPFPSIQGTESIAAWSTAKEPYLSLGLSHATWHGAMAAVAFMGILLPGGIATRRGLKIRFHWMVQLFGLLCCLCAIYFGTRRAIESNTGIRLHQGIGILVTLCLPVQAWIGYHNHAFYTAKKKKSNLNLLHKWLGRATICGGITNVGLGIYSSGYSALVVGLWTVSAILEGLIYIYVGILEPGYRHYESITPHDVVEMASLIEEENVPR